MAVAMLGALATTIVVMGTIALLDRAAAPMPFADRLQTALRADLFVVAWLAAAIANVARLRFFSERDIAGSSAENASPEVRRARAILQNSFEQVCLAILAHVILAASLENSQTMIEAMVILFSIGRLLFWMGYKHGAKARAFGFALSFYPTMMALLSAAAAILLSWLA